MSGPTRSKAILWGTNTTELGTGLFPTNEIRPVAMNAAGILYTMTVGAAPDGSIIQLPIAIWNNDSDAIAVGEGQQAGDAQRATVFLHAFNGATMDRVRTLASDTDAQDAAQIGLQGHVARGQMFNGTAWDRARSASAANQATLSKVGLAAVAQPGEWTVFHTPVANTQAIASRPAGGGGVRHVCTSIVAKLIGVAAIAAPILVNLRDGVSGAGAIIWSGYLFAGAANSKDEYELTGLAIVGSANTLMTLEFAAGPGATNFESVAMTGYSVI